MKQTRLLVILSSTILLLSYGCKKGPGIVTPVPAPVTPPPAPTVALKTADSIVTVEELPTGLAEAKRLAQGFPASDFSTTGFYLPPNTTLTLEVTQLNGSTLPKILVGTYSRYKGNKWNPATFNLSTGTNTISDPDGGILYIRYTATTPAANKARIRFISGMKPIPYYQLGKTTQAEWVTMVDNLSAVPDVQLVGKKTIITFSRQNALSYKNDNQEALIHKADRVIAIEDSISALFGTDPLDQPNVHKYLMTESDEPAYFMAATYYRTWYRNADAVPAILTANNLTWGPWHELGHMHQQGAWTWSELGEVTVNVYSIAVERALGITPTRLKSDGVWNQAATYLAKPEAEKDFNAGTTSVWVRLAMFQQLYLAFGNNFYYELHRQARRETVQPVSREDKMRWFMLKACNISGKDLSGFFKKWGFNVGSAVYAELAVLKLPVPTQDPGTLAE